MKTSKAVPHFAAAVCILILLSCPASLARTIYVDANAPTFGDGASWANAYKHLQDALADANDSDKPVEIRVAQGVYTPDKSSAHPDGTRDRSASFCLLDGVAILGGFAGLGAPDPNARDIALYETILSGDLAGDDAPVLNARDLLTEPTRAENSYSVATAAPHSRSAVLDGFIISSGNAIGPERHQLDQRGGGLLLSHYGAACLPSIRNCTFRDNSAHYGGAVFVIGAGPEFIDCRFLNNAAAQGGAISTSAWRDPWAGSHTDVVIRRCAFTGNYARAGGAISGNYARAGGAIYRGAGRSFTIEASRFVRNVAETGGALYVSVDTSIVNCLFIHNLAQQTGGAIFCKALSVHIASCTFAGNTAPKGLALTCFAPRTTISNTIFWNGGDNKRNVEIFIGAITGVDMTYSNIQGGWPGEGNIDVDPLFAQPGYWADPDDPNRPGNPDDPNAVWVDGDYHLKSQGGRWDPGAGGWVRDDVTSPCIDAGDPMSPIGMEPFPNGGRINMGAYGGTAEASKSYFGEPICETILPGDLNGDCRVDWKDLAILARHWLRDETAQAESPAPPR